MIEFHATNSGSRISSTNWCAISMHERIPDISMSFKTNPNQTIILRMKEKVKLSGFWRLWLRVRKCSQSLLVDLFNQIK